MPSLVTRTTTQLRSSWFWLALAGVCVGCNPNGSSAPSRSEERASSTQPASQICERLQEKQVTNSNIVEIDQFLKKAFPDWNEKREADPLSHAPWPPEFETCFVESMNEIRIKGASCDGFRDLLTDADAWKEVYSNAHSISAAGTLKDGVAFKFRTFGSDQECLVDSDTPRAGGFTFGWTCKNTPLIPRALTGGDDVLPLGHVHHRWNCTETRNDLLVSTQECQVGAAIEAADALLLGGLQDMMQRGHQVWLEGIKCKLTNPKWSLRNDTGAPVG